MGLETLKWYTGAVTAQKVGAIGSNCTILFQNDIFSNKIKFEQNSRE